MSTVERERPRIEALLGIGGDDDVVVTESWIDPAESGALEGIGFSWPESAAKVSVLVFGDYEDAAQVLPGLRENAPELTVVESTVNGPLLLWATAPADDDEALARINDLASSFAGEE